MELYQIFHENREVFIVDKKCKLMAVIKYDDIFQYAETIPQIYPNDPNCILKLLIGFIDSGLMKIMKQIDHFSITCKLLNSNAAVLGVLVLFIPIELFIYKWNNIEFSISRTGKTIIFKDNRKKRKFLHNIFDLYKMMDNVMNYTLEIFERIIISGIDNVNWNLKEESEKYVITYKWVGENNGQFNLIIPYYNFENENDKERAVDITVIPKSDIVVHEINTLLKYHIDDQKILVDENDLGVSTKISYEMARFHCYVDRLLYSDNTLKKMWKMYPHLKKADCDQLVEDYKNGKVQVHSGTYDECEISNGYGYYNIIGNRGTSMWKYGSLKFKRWSCCPLINITGVIIDVGIGYQIDIEEIFKFTTANIYMPKIMNFKEGYTPFVRCKDFLYSNVINHIRDLDVEFYYLTYSSLSPEERINKKDIEKYISGYGLPSPTTFCYNPKFI